MMPGTSEPGFRIGRQAHRREQGSLRFVRDLMAAAVDGRKAVMAEPADAERTTGYVLGGISPLGQRKSLPTVVDASALTFPTVLVSAGRRGLQVELSPADLVRLTRARTASIGR